MTMPTLRQGFLGPYVDERQFVRGPQRSSSYGIAIVSLG
jgi:hypothetical protein